MLTPGSLRTYTQLCVCVVVGWNDKIYRRRPIRSAIIINADNGRGQIVRKCPKISAPPCPSWIRVVINVPVSRSRMIPTTHRVLRRHIYLRLETPCRNANTNLSFVDPIIFVMSVTALLRNCPGQSQSIKLSIVHNNKGYTSVLEICRGMQYETQ